MCLDLYCIYVLGLSLQSLYMQYILFPPSTPSAPNPQQHGAPNPSQQGKGQGGLLQVFEAQPWWCDLNRSSIERPILGGKWWKKLGDMYNSGHLHL